MRIDIFVSARKTMRGAIEMRRPIYPPRDRAAISLVRKVSRDRPLDLMVRRGRRVDKNGNQIRAEAG